MENRAFNMDCLEAMRSMPDQCFDLAVVDPPYGVGSVTYMPRTREKAHGGFIDKYNITIATLDMNQRGKVKANIIPGWTGEGTIKNFGDDNISPGPEYFEQLFRVSRNQIIWGGNYYLLPPSRGFLIWRKTTVAENFSMAMCEYAWMSFDSNSKIFEAAPQGTKRIHVFTPHKSRRRCMPGFFNTTQSQGIGSWIHTWGAGQAGSPHGTPAWILSGTRLTRSISRHRKSGSSSTPRNCPCSAGGGGI